MPSLGNSSTILSRRNALSGHQIRYVLANSNLMAAAGLSRSAAPNCKTGLLPIRRLPG